MTTFPHMEKVHLWQLPGAGHLTSLPRKEWRFADFAQLVTAVRLCQLKQEKLVKLRMWRNGTKLL